MHISDSVRRVALLGYGVEGAATLRALTRWGFEGELTVLDDGPPPEGFARAWSGAREHDLEGVELLIKTPGISPSHPAWRRCVERGIPSTTATNLYLKAARDAGALVVGVTGSKGKSTTASLIHRGLLAAGRDAVLVGNIGRPALDALDDVIARGAVTVFELSSYQCSTLVEGPEIAVITSLFPEHIDWHGDVETYYADKLRIASAQRPSDLCVWNGAEPRLVARAPLGPARQRAYDVPGAWRWEQGVFRHGDRALSDEGMRLRGRHNRANLCGALCALEALGVDAAVALPAMRAFEGLPHRLEDLGEHGGVRWINDSISTAPEAAVAALEAFGGEAATMIVGGYDRGYDFSGLALALRARGIKAVAALPPSGRRLLELLRDSDIDHVEAEDLEAAVRWIAPRTPRSRVCLFSPASPSYGRYRDFIARGEHLRALVSAL